MSAGPEGCLRTKEQGKGPTTSFPDAARPHLPGRPGPATSVSFQFERPAAERQADTLTVRLAEERPTSVHGRSDPSKPCTSCAPTPDIRSAVSAASYAAARWFGLWLQCGDATRQEIPRERAVERPFRACLTAEGPSPHLIAANDFPECLPRSKASHLNLRHHRLSLTPPVDGAVRFTERLQRADPVLRRARCTR